jgi:hypothetical protein
MRKISNIAGVVWVFIVIVGLFSASGQSLRREERNHNCKESNKFTSVDRLKNYPFDQAVTVRLVSFDNKPDSTIEEHILPQKNGRVDTSVLSEQTTLSKRQIDSLTHILYNIGYSGKILTSEVSMCYNPRNAILFLDSTEQVFEFIEICFECNNLRLSSGKIKTGEFCTQKYEMLNAYFAQNKIEIGTVKER